MIPPNIPLRLGPSGPPANIPAILLAAGVISVRRAWARCLTDAGYVPENSTPPLLGILGCPIVWTAEEVELADSLFYLVHQHATIGEFRDATILPAGVELIVGWLPAGGAEVSLKAQPIRVVPMSADPEDFSFFGTQHASYIFPARGYGPDFALGSNAINLNVSNAAPYGPLEVRQAQQVVIELVGDASLFDLIQSVPGPPAPPPT